MIHLVIEVELNIIIPKRMEKVLNLIQQINQLFWLEDRLN